MRDAASLEAGPKSLRIFTRDLLGTPLVVVLGEKLHALASAIAGAFRGVEGIPERWLAKIGDEVSGQYREQASQLAALVRQRADVADHYARTVAGLT